MFDKTRFRNPWFWVGIIGAILTATGMEPEMFTSWDILFSSIKDVLNNPFLIGSIILTVLGIFVDPTTSGLTDRNKTLKSKR